MSSNPYSDFFEHGKRKAQPPSIQPIPEEHSEEEAPALESLDEILLHISTFNQEAEAFSHLLTQTNVTEHKVRAPLLRLFIELEDKHAKNSLRGERDYYDVLQYKFRQIIVPMRGLAKLHVQIVEQFNKDIDQNYYSIEKSERSVALDKNNAIEGINLQRKILADAAENLTILRDAMMDSERRIKGYINVGGLHNISRSEHELLVQKRTALTNGQEHQFNYAIFEMNLIDQAAISLGFYQKDTTQSYINKALTAFDFA